MKNFSQNIKKFEKLDNAFYTILGISLQDRLCSINSHFLEYLPIFVQSTILVNSGMFCQHRGDSPIHTIQQLRLIYLVYPPDQTFINFSL